MEQQESYSEEELLASAKRLLANGHRFAYILKYLRERTPDDDLITKILNTIKADDAANEARAKQLKKQSGSKISYINVGMGILFIVLGIIVHFMLRSRGFIGTLPIILIGAGAVLSIRELMKGSNKG
ncbi:MAG: hypothetical protein AAF806_12705 [Bacteroidota bacterium]